MHPELSHYLHMIADLRTQVNDLISDLPAVVLNWRPLPQVDEHATNSLAVLSAHIAGAEHFWVAEVIARQPASRDREAEFALVVEDGSVLQQRLHDVATETHGILTALPPAVLDETREVHGHTVSVRWSLLHVIDHTALHLGHMQITYQLWMHGRARPSPRWFQRV
ncbi:MAG: DUF664 domain-containing protein [Chloroflexi bacterium]|nr:DUF664 domain-containing protein [Chloroflexota bacterium]